MTLEIQAANSAPRGGGDRSILTPAEQAIKARLLTIGSLDASIWQLYESLYVGRKLSESEENVVGGGQTTLLGWSPIAYNYPGRIIDNEAGDYVLKWILTGDLEILEALQEGFTKKIEEDLRLRSNVELTKLQIPKVRKKTPGFIYVIKSGDAYKIGKSRKLSERLKQHNSSNPNGLELVLDASSDDYSSDERALHQLFEEKRIKGEWFALDEKDLDNIKEYLGLEEDSQ